MNETDLKNMHAIVNDVWKLFREYAQRIPMSPVDWQQEVAAAIAFVDTHPKQNRLARKLIAVVEDELEQLDKEAKERNC